MLALVGRMFHDSGATGKVDLFELITGRIKLDDIVERGIDAGT